MKESHTEKNIFGELLKYSYYIFLNLRKLDNCVFEIQPNEEFKSMNMIFLSVT